MEKINKNDKYNIDFESIKIQDLDLSIRSYNCLIYANIRDLSQLVNMSEEDLRNIRNMGMMSVIEIKQKVEEKLNSLGFTLDEAKDLQRKRNREKVMEFFDLSRVSLGDLELSPRSHNGLARTNIHNLAELILVSEERLLKVRQLGPMSLEEIKMKVKKKLDDFGITLEEAIELQQKREKEKVKGIKYVQEKEQILEKFEEKIVTLLRAKPCRDFTKNSKSYEDIAKIVEDFLNEILDTEMQKAQSEEEILLIQKTLEEMRETFKKIVDSKRKNITLEEKKFGASDVEKYKNTELKKYRKKQPNVTDPTFDADAHNYNSFTNTGGLSL